MWANTPWLRFISIATISGVFPSEFKNSRAPGFMSIKSWVLASVRFLMAKNKALPFRTSVSQMTDDNLATSPVDCKEGIRFANTRYKFFCSLFKIGYKGLVGTDVVSTAGVSNGRRFKRPYNLQRMPSSISKSGWASPCATEFISAIPFADDYVYENSCVYICYIFILATDVARAELFLMAFWQKLYFKALEHCLYATGSYNIPTALQMRLSVILMLFREIRTIRLFILPIGCVSRYTRHGVSWPLK